jgi:tRNA pseudouridine32 synthase/23S rRNA pseudouridine746 synthase
MDFLVARFPHISAEDWQQRLAQGLVLGDEGQPLQADTPATDGGWLYYYRAVESETAIPFEHQVLYRDAHLLVVDKPHFLPVIPSGQYLQHTLLLRLKQSFNLPDLVPIHRIDRDTAGLVLFSLQAESRDAYSALFRERRVAKTYEAIAPFDAALAMPRACHVDTPVIANGTLRAMHLLADWLPRPAIQQLVQRSPQQPDLRWA